MRQHLHTQVTKQKLLDQKGVGFTSSRDTRVVIDRQQRLWREIDPTLDPRKPKQEVLSDANDTNDVF